MAVAGATETAAEETAVVAPVVGNAGRQRAGKGSSTPARYWLVLRCKCTGLLFWLICADFVPLQTVAAAKIFFNLTR